MAEYTSSYTGPQIDAAVQKSGNMVLCTANQGLSATDKTNARNNIGAGTSNLGDPEPYNGHAYVEIGGLKWATMNVGASSITDYGLYFQWGDTQGYTVSQLGSGNGQKLFDWASYKYGNGTSNPGTSGMTKYNSSDGKTVLDQMDDAAFVYFGGSWRIPTKNEFAALGAAVNTSWTYNYNSSGVSGLICTSKTDSSKVLFFPAAGNCYEDEFNSESYFGTYWSSSLNSSNVQNSSYMYFSSDGDRCWNDYDIERNYGLTIRPVSSGNTPATLGWAAFKGVSSTVSSGDTNLVSSGLMYSTFGSILSQLQNI